MDYRDLGDSNIVPNIFDNMKDNKNKSNRVRNSKLLNNNKINKLENN